MRNRAPIAQRLATDGLKHSPSASREQSGPAVCAVGSRAGVCSRARPNAAEAACMCLCMLASVQQTCRKGTRGWWFGSASGLMSNVCPCVNITGPEGDTRRRSSPSPSASELHNRGAGSKCSASTATDSRKRDRICRRAGTCWCNRLGLARSEASGMKPGRDGACGQHNCRPRGARVQGTWATTRTGCMTTAACLLRPRPPRGGAGHFWGSSRVPKVRQRVLTSRRWPRAPQVAMHNGRQ